MNFQNTTRQQNLGNQESVKTFGSGATKLPTIRGQMNLPRKLLTVSSYMKAVSKHHSLVESIREHGSKTAAESRRSSRQSSLKQLCNRQIYYVA